MKAPPTRDAGDAVIGARVGRAATTCSSPLDAQMPAREPLRDRR
jgi:hypothetical protein